MASIHTRAGTGGTHVWGRKQLLGVTTDDLPEWLMRCPLSPQ